MLNRLTRIKDDTIIIMSFEVLSGRFRGIVV